MSTPDVPGLGDPVARALCDRDDTWEHHYATDDYPRTACKGIAESSLTGAVRAAEARGEQREREAERQVERAACAAAIRLAATQVAHTEWEAYVGAPAAAIENGWHRPDLPGHIGSRSWTDDEGAAVG